MRTRVLLLSGLLTVSGASLASADPITIPQGLAPGSVYHLAFVTSGIHNALSTDIADYDAFVTAQANLDPDLAALNTTWKVIGSTATVDAIDHIGVVGPVYNTRGELVAFGSADMFNGGINAPIAYYQDGGAFVGDEYVWTGTNAFTGRAGSIPLGNPGVQLPDFCTPLPNGTQTCMHVFQGPIYGHASFTYTFGPEWLSYGVAPFLAVNPVHFYGISGALVVPFPETDPPTTSVPEPGTLSAMFAPVLMLLLWGARRA